MTDRDRTTGSTRHDRLEGLAKFTDWHGWSFKGHALHVGELPGRKSLCLYAVVDGNTIRTLAFFKNEEAAKTCLRFLDSLAGVGS